MKLKLDLHTHLQEATQFAPPDEETVGRIVAMAKKRGLDGLAITDHDALNYARRVRQVVEHCFNGALIIIPGQEKRAGDHHVVELYLNDDSVFRFIAHPGYLFHTNHHQFDGIHGLEIHNSYWYIDQEKISEIAEKNDLIPLSNSDAHSLADIGRYYNLIDLDQLFSRAEKIPQE
jgi:PHP family Zn ribbon phosphoesterase